MRTTVMVTDPHHEFFGRICVLQTFGENTYVRPLYDTVTLSIETNQYEKTSSDE